MTKLSSLGKLLDFGADCIKRQNIKVLRLKGAKRIFFPMLVAAHNYTEAIFALCKENRTPPSSSLLRSLCENYINAKFLLCNKRKHAHVIYLDGLIEKKKQLNDTQAFLKKNPHRAAETGLSTNEVDKALKKVAAREKKVRTKIDTFLGNLILGTQGRAKHADEYNTNKHAKSASLEWIYILIFRTLSSATHINFLEFTRYFKLEAQEIVIFLSGNSDETPIIVALANYLYKEILGTFLKVFKSPLLTEFHELCRNGT